MRKLCAIALSVSLSLQCVKALSIQSPLAQSQLTIGEPFQVAWGLDNPPVADDGTLNIYLVRDPAATSVVSQIVSSALVLLAAMPAIIPIGTIAGQYYLQLKVTSGSEKSAIGGPFNVVNVASTNNNTTTTTTTTVTVGGETITSYTLPTDSPQPATVGSSQSSTQSPLASGAIAGIVIGTLIAFGAIMATWFIWYRRRYPSNTREVAMNKPLPGFNYPSSDPTHFSQYNHYSLDRPYHGFQYGHWNGISPADEYPCPASIANQTMPSSDTQSQYQPYLSPIPSVSYQNSHTGSGASTVRQYRSSLAAGSAGPATHSSGSSTVSPPRSTDTAIYRPASEQVTFSPPHTPSSPVLSPSMPPQ